MSTVALSHRLDLTRAAGGESGGGSGWRRRELASTTMRHGSASMAAVAHLLTTRGGAGWPRREATRMTLPSPPLSQFSPVTLYFLPLLSLAHTTRVVVLGCCCSLWIFGSCCCWGRSLRLFSLWIFGSCCCWGRSLRLFSLWMFLLEAYRSTRLASGLPPSSQALFEVMATLPRLCCHTK
jgi:hypothetical protein